MCLLKTVAFLTNSWGQLSPQLVYLVLTPPETHTLALLQFEEPLTNECEQIQVPIIFVRLFTIHRHFRPVETFDGPVLCPVVQAQRNDHSSKIRESGKSCSTVDGEALLEAI